jgi:hypothetical protein
MVAYLGFCGGENLSAVYLCSDYCVTNVWHLYALMISPYLGSPNLQYYKVRILTTNDQISPQRSRQDTLKVEICENLPKQMTLLLSTCKSRERHGDDDAIEFGVWMGWWTPSHLSPLFLSSPCI